MEFIKSADLKDEFLFFMRESGEIFYRRLFSENYEIVLKKLFSLSNNPFSHRFAEFAVIRGKVVGMHLSYSYEDRADPFKTIGDFSKAIGFCGFIRILPKLMCLGLKDRIRPGDFYLSNIAVHPDMRGVGIGSAMMSRIFKIAMEKGTRRIVLNVEERNERAIRFYRKHGFEVVREIELLGIPYLRMSKEVS